jgi:hypothetical protein
MLLAGTYPLVVSRSSAESRILTFHIQKNGRVQISELSSRGRLKFDWPISEGEIK